MKGIDILSRWVKKHRHMCFMIVGYNTTFEEDIYRFRKLTESGVDPYVMVYDDLPDIKLRHFARWVNGRVYKKCSFEDYRPWAKAQSENAGLLFSCAEC